MNGFGNKRTTFRVAYSRNKLGTLVWDPKHHKLKSENAHNTDFQLMSSGQVGSLAYTNLANKTYLLLHQMKYIKIGSALFGAAILMPLLDHREGEKNTAEPFFISCQLIGSNQIFCAMNF